MAGVNTINTQHTGGQNDFNRPGWTEFASDLYNTSRDVYFLWTDSGFPRQGELFWIGTYLFDQTTIQYIFMRIEWSGDCAKAKHSR